MGTCYTHTQNLHVHNAILIRGTTRFTVA